LGCQASSPGHASAKPTFNLQFMADKLQYHKVISCSNIENLIQSLCCENLKKERIYREYFLCQAKELKTSDFDAGEQTMEI
jgi:hypothetical protein